VRWLLLGDFLWLLTHPNKFVAVPEFLKFWGTGYDIASFEDPYPAVGAIIEGSLSLTNKERREHAFERGWGERL
jgi:hypothetical protein